MVPSQGFEPRTPSFVARCAVQLRHEGRRCMAPRTELESVIFALTRRYVGRYTNAG